MLIKKKKFGTLIRQQHCYAKRKQIDDESTAAQ